MGSGNNRKIQNEKWTFEKCLELARGCKYAIELKDKSNGAYNAARKNGWLKDYSWFKNPHIGYKGNNGIWTESECREEALKYTIKRDFNEANPSAYESARYHGWLRDYTWLRDGRGSGITRSTGYKSLKNNHSHPKYTDEQIIEAAKKYTKKVDFLHNDNALYHAALHRGLMSQFTWLRSSAHLFDSINFVYRYYFKDQNAVYVGRTINPKDRDFEHHRDRGDESSTVLKFAQEKGVEIPPMEILAENLSGIDSQRVEDEYVRKYRTGGMRVLNIGATGVGRGSMGMKKRNSKKKFREVALRYTELATFRKEQPRFYEAGYKYGWLEECSWLERKVRKSSVFSKEYCLEIAKSCASRKEVFERDSTVYSKMVKNGWFAECDWLASQHDGRRTLSHNYCLKIAKKYSSLTLLQKEQAPVLKKLYKTGWVDECTWFPDRKIRPICKYSLEGEVREIFASLSEAAKSVENKYGNCGKYIMQCCKGKLKSAYGFVWRFADRDATNKEPGLTADGNI